MDDNSDGKKLVTGNYRRLMFFVLFSFSIFAAALAIHVASFFLVSTQVELKILLMLGVFIAILFPGRYSLNSWDATKKDLNLVPTWIQPLIFIFFVYAAINFVSALSFMEGGYGEIENGKYYLMSHGDIIREVTKEKYILLKAYESRQASGHIMLFSIIAATVNLFRINRNRVIAEEEAEEAKHSN